MVLVVAVLAMLGGAPLEARADDGPSVEFLQSKLKSDDFRVRFNAALALGGKSGNDDHPKAVASLCEALADEKEAVRTAIASALKRLAKPSALPCLRTRLAAEPSNDVKLGITRAIESIEAAAGANGGGGGGGGQDPGGNAPPGNNPNAKYYVAYTIANTTSRTAGELDGLVVKPMRAKLDGAGTFQLAPTGESADAARGVMQKRKLTGFYISVQVTMNYVDDPTNGLMLKVRLSVAVSTYPGKALKGSFDKGVSQAVGRRGDKASEDNLLNIAASLAFDQFTQNAQMFL